MVGKPLLRERESKIWIQKALLAFLSDRFCMCFQLLLQKFRIVSLLIVLIGPFSARAIFAQLSNDELRNYKETWENEENELSERWEAVSTLSTGHYIQLNPDSAFYFAHEYYESALKEQDTLEIIYALIALHCAQNAKGEFVESISPLEEVITLSKASGEWGLESSIKTEIGMVYIRIGQEEKGVDYLFQGIDLSIEKEEEWMTSKSDWVNVFYNIARIYLLLNDGKSAKPYMELADSYHPQFIGTRDSVVRLNNLGYTYIASGDFSKAKGKFLQALAVGEFYDLTYGETLIGLGEIYQVDNQLDSSLYFSGKALTILEKTGHHPEEVKALGNLGLAYLGEKEYEKALDCGLRALPMAESMNSLPELILVSNVLYQAYKGLGESSKSLEFHERYVNFKTKSEARDIRLELKSKEFTKLLEDKEELMMAKLDQTDRVHQTRLFFFVGSCMLLLCIVVFYYTRGLLKKKQERILLMNQIEGLKKVASERDTQPAPKLELKELGTQTLNKVKIEAAIDAKLNKTDWKILNALVKSPAVSNKEIAETIFLSIPGVRSSLQKMYRLFDIDGNTGNRRIALVLAAIQASAA